MSTFEELGIILKRQKRACARDGIPDFRLRQNRLTRVIQLLIDNQDALCDAMNVDFTHRPRQQSLIADIYGTIALLRHAKNNVNQWMKVKQCGAQMPFRFYGAKARISYQPQGVVGVLSTWHFPVWAPLSPLAGVLAAGNRCMIKLSEVTPITSGLLEDLIGQYFDQDELVAINGGIETAESFFRLDFDHLLFTGSTVVGKKIMRATADDLIPLTLRLGGKSPVIIGKETNIAKVARRLVLGKSLNAGQVCSMPDYVFVKDGWLNDLIAEIERGFQQHFPSILNNPDYSSVVNERHYHRLLGYIEDVRNKGGEIWEVNPANESLREQSNTFKIPLTLIINPSDEMLVMQNEILGPLLPIKSYYHIDEVIEYINRQPKSPCLYYFGDNKKEINYVITSTRSGEVIINDTAQHATYYADFPFGGFSASGIGSYRGMEEFKTFSDERVIYTQSRINFMKWPEFLLPHNTKITDSLQASIKKNS